jgi:phosphoserine phosphatase RsbU/P
MKREDADLQRTRKLEILYIVALSIIALLSLASQYLIHQALQKQDDDATIINVAGRQAMLSQRIAKSAFSLYYNKSEAAKSEAPFQELKAALSELTRAQNGLKTGDEALKLPGNNSEEIKKLFDAVEPSYTKLVANVQQIVNYYENKYQRFDQYSDKSFRELMIHEKAYLEGMNKVVLQYESEAKQKIDSLRQFEIGLLILTFIILLLEAFFIFRPAYKKIRQTIRSLHDSRSQMIEANSILKSSQQEIQMRMREVQQAREEIDVAYSEVSKREGLYAELNADMLASLQYARRIQRAILPDTMHLNGFSDKNFIFYEPKNIVSGDFYFFIEHDECFYLAAADCTGHGVPGAFMSVLGISIMNNIIEEGFSTPGIILGELHKRVILTLKQQYDEAEIQDGMDIALCKINADRTKLEFSGANRPAILIDTEENMTRLEPVKMPIGQSNYDESNIYRSYDTQFVDIQRGTTIYLFSDGYPDQFNDESKRITNKGFINLIQEAHLKPIYEQYEHFKCNFENWKANTEQTDDVLVLGVVV